jgi:hypothetical protein
LRIAGGLQSIRVTQISREIRVTIMNLQFLISNLPFQ